MMVYFIFFFKIELGRKEGENRTDKEREIYRENNRHNLLYTIYRAIEQR